MPSSIPNTHPCKICFAEHDDEIHGATLRVRAWFHRQVMQGFNGYGYAEEPIPAARAEEPAVEAAAVA